MTEWQAMLTWPKKTVFTRHVHDVSVKVTLLHLPSGKKMGKIRGGMETHHSVLEQNYAF